MPGEAKSDPELGAGGPMGAGHLAGCVLGIDGCRGGWVWVSLDGGNQDQGLVPDLTGLLPRLSTARLALIDIPIGLKDGGPGERRCDREARALLGRPRGSSVFRPPCRAALAAADYRCGCAVNLGQTGVALSRQSWNLVPKIREADRLLQHHPGLIGVLREAHPELALWGLNGGRAMAQGKKGEAGQRERVELLERLSPGANGRLKALLAAHPRHRLAWDDAADALALALAAHAAVLGQMQVLPGEPERDGRGLPMEIVYATVARHGGLEPHG